MYGHKCIRVTVANRMKHASVLLVGEVEELLHMLADTLVKTPALSLQVHIADKLPLDIDGDESICEVDFVVMVIDMTKRMTFASVKKSLSYLPRDFYLGRLLFVAHNASKLTEWSVEAEEITLLANECLSHVLWERISTNNSLLAEQILNYLKVGLGSMAALHTPLSGDSTVGL